MRKRIEDIYSTYTIPPHLQLHQRRVAAVGKLVSEAHGADVHTVVSACLLHDMGNIIKFKLDRFPEFLQPEGYEYWKKVQDTFKEKYGTDEHLATLIICDELGVSDAVLNCIRAVGMTRVHHNVTEGTLEERITNYADLRVGPKGLMSIHERLADGKVRNGNTHDGVTLTDAGFRTMSAQIVELERMLTTPTCTPQALTGDMCAPLIETLRAYEI
jgi:hypothetical protein